VQRNLTILIVESDQNYVDLLSRAFARHGIANPLQVTRDGQEALDYLGAKGKFENRQMFPFPSVILTEIKLPRLSGFEILRWLPNHDDCWVVPVIVLSASLLDADIREAYNCGANAYFEKPKTLEELGKLIGVLHDFWRLALKPAMPTKC
jgi:CheY-like chemotaxis protein